MKNIRIMAVVLLLASCSNKLKLSVPQAFREQASELHVKGAYKNKMSLGNFTTSKIKRGIHATYPGWGRGFFLENLLLNQFGISKTELVTKEKASFSYSITNGNGNAEVYGKENELSRNTAYRLLNNNRIFSSFEQVNEYRYVFAALIKIDNITAGNWELAMSNIYERARDTSRSLFKVIRPDDHGFATNGSDSIFIRPVTLRNTEGPDGKQGRLLVKMLGGYELSTAAGVVAVIDVIDHNLWLYKELEQQQQLAIAAITTALLARKVNDTKW